jgi:predicted RNase H-like nuclease (RuvC/YqgF family)
MIYTPLMVYNTPKYREMHQEKEMNHKRNKEIEAAIERCEELEKENAELKAHVELLCGHLNAAYYQFEYDSPLAIKIGDVLERIPAKSLAAHDMQIAEKVRKACALAAKDSCLLPPDGGSPSDDEVAVSDAAVTMISAIDLEELLK